MSRSLIHLESLKYIGLVEDVLLPFLPTYLVEMVVLFLVLRRHDSARRVSEPRERLPVHNLWILPLQVWSLQAALLSHRNILISWIGVGLTDITPHEEPLIGLFRSLLALLVVITCQLTGVLITRSSANTLAGLSPFFVTGRRAGRETDFLGAVAGVPGRAGSCREAA